MTGSCCLPWIAAAVCPLAAATSDADSDRALLADAAARVSFQQAPTAGHDGKFFLASASGDSRLEIGALTQFRYTVNLRDTSPADKDLTNGFDFRRAKLFLGGKLPRDTTFYLQGGFAIGGGDFSFEFAQMNHKLGEHLTVTWGQFKMPFLQEELVSEKMLLAADRSIMHAVFTAGFDHGVMLCYEADRWGLSTAASDGAGTANTAYYSPAEADWALTARAQYRLGDAPWGAYYAFNSFRETPTGAMAGAALHWQTAGDTGNTLTFAGTPAADTDMLAYTADLLYKGGGWSLYGALVGRTTDTDGLPAYDDFGAIAQGSLFVTDRDELFARWDAVFPDDDRGAGEDFHTLTVGASHYFFPGSYAARLTADLQWYPEDQSGSSSLIRAPSAASQLLPDPEGDQACLRIQMQLLF